MSYVMILAPCMMIGAFAQLDILDPSNIPGLGGIGDLEIGLPDFTPPGTGDGTTPALTIQELQAHIATLEGIIQSYDLPRELWDEAASYGLTPPFEIETQLAELRIQLEQAIQSAADTEAQMIQDAQDARWAELEAMRAERLAKEALENKTRHFLHNNMTHHITIQLSATCERLQECPTYNELRLLDTSYHVFDTWHINEHDIIRRDTYNPASYYTIYPKLMPDDLRMHTVVDAEYWETVRFPTITIVPRLTPYIHGDAELSWDDSTRSITSWQGVYVSEDCRNASIQADIFWEVIPYVLFELRTKCIYDTLRDYRTVQTVPTYEQPYWSDQAAELQWWYETAPEACKEWRAC